MTDYPTMQQQCRMEPAAAVRWQALMLLERRRRWLTTSQTKLDKYTGINVGLTLSPAREALPFLLEVDRAALRSMREDLAASRPGLADWIRWSHDLTPGGLGLNVSPKWTACPRATAACAFACVGKGGQGRLQSSQIARIGRTLAYHMAPSLATEQIAREVAQKAGRRNAERTVWLRTNVATDGPERAATILATARALAFQRRRIDPARIRAYDYTAIPEALQRRDGVVRCLSYKGTRRSERECREALAAGHRVAVVFDIGRDDPKPATWHGHTVRDGDQHDVWPVFTGPGEVVGLYLKGMPAEKQRARRAGFAVDPTVNP